MSAEHNSELTIMTSLEAVRNILDIVQKQYHCRLYQR